MPWKCLEKALIFQRGFRQKKAETGKRPEFLPGLAKNKADFFKAPDPKAPQPGAESGANVGSQIKKLPHQSTQDAHGQGQDAFFQFP